jgi:pyruvate dehydrogenase E2 component (dihydrolipoyllysine-residue acetyltransferase)
MAEVTMPRLSDTMSEGAVGKWLKQPGDQVADGDIIAEIETDKATMELQAFESGTLQKILVPEGQTVAIGTPIAIIGDGAPEAAPAEKAEASAPASADEQAPTEEGGAQAVERTTAEAQAQVQPTAAQAQPQAQPPAQAAAPSANGDRIKASPVARRLADERGIDLRQVKGTGPGGRIIKENVEDFKPEAAKAPAAAPAAQPAAPTAPQPQQPAPSADAVPMSRMRRAIARAMTDSQPGTPHIYVSAEVDMAAAMALRKQINDSGAAEVKISVNDLVVKAAAKALLKFQRLNSSYATSADGQPAVLAHAQINVSVAVALEDGLVAPVVRDADKKAIGAIAAEIKDMAGRAREGKIKQNELDGGTFQVSNLGMFDVVEFTSIIPAPLAASLSVGAVRQTPVVRDGQLAIGERMTVTISVDHRVADGATAAQYLQELRRLLEAPMSLLV